MGVACRTMYVVNVLSLLFCFVSESSLDWSKGTQNIKECLQKQIKAQKKCIKMKEKHLHRQHTVLKRLLQYAKVSPMLASEAISESSGGHHWLSKEKLGCVAPTSGDGMCRSTALPYSKYCLQRESNSIWPCFMLCQ